MDAASERDHALGMFRQRRIIDERRLPGRGYVLRGGKFQKIMIALFIRGINEQLICRLALAAAAFRCPDATATGAARTAVAAVFPEPATGTGGDDGIDAALIQKVLRFDSFLGGNMTGYFDVAGDVMLHRER